MRQFQLSLGTLVALASTFTRATIQTFCPENANQVCYSVAVPSSSAASGSGNIYFQILAPASHSWVALATGSNMGNANMFIVYQDGAGNMTVSPRKTTRHNPPTLDTSSTAAKLTLMAGSGVTTDGMMIANVRCANCQSWSTGSMSLSSSSTSWISAWKSGNSMATTNTAAGITQHDDYRIFGLDLTAATIASDTNPFIASDSTGGGGGGDSSGNNGTTGGNGSSGGSSNGGSSTGGSSSGVILGGAPPKPSAKVLAAHGIIMALVFVIMYPIAAILMPLLGKWQVHAAAQVLSFLLMWVGFGLGVQAAKERLMLFDNTHTLMGTVVVCLLFIQPFLGYAHHMHYVKHKRRGLVSYVHIFWGQSLIIVGLVNGGLGLELAGASTSLVVAYAVVAAVVFTVYAVVKVFTLFKASHDSSRGAKEAPSPPLGRSPPSQFAYQHQQSPSPQSQTQQQQYQQQQQQQQQGQTQQNLRGGGYAPTPRSRDNYASPPAAYPSPPQQSRRRPYP